MAIMFYSSISERLLPETSLEEGTRSLAFRMGSIELAEYERLLSAPHKRPPITTFLAWQVPPVAADLKALARARPCLLDPFTAEFLEAFDMSTPGRKVLGLILKMAFSDTVRQECWHARVKRLVTRIGTMSHRPNFYDVSALQATHRLRKRDEDRSVWGANLPSAQCARAPEGTELAATSRRQQRRRGGGGAWRAHASKKLREGASMSSLGGSYRARTDGEIANDQRAGNRATQEHRGGNACPFGLHRRQARQEQAKSAALAFCSEQVISDASFIDGEKNVMTPSLGNIDPDSVTSAISMVRRSLRFDAATSRAHEVELDSTSPPTPLVKVLQPSRMWWTQFHP